MNSTPNYGFNLQVCGADGIDRELNRIENKIDCKFSNILSKCELEKHFVNPDAHKELLDKKVDKKDGFNLIPDDCLHQICTNKDNVSLLEQYIKELQEQNAGLQEYIDTELANKVNINGKPVWHELDLLNGFTHNDSTHHYTKDNLGWVEVTSVLMRNEVPQNEELVAILPEGFRPNATIRSIIAQGYGSWFTYLTIRSDGGIYFHAGTISSDGYMANRAMAFSAVFRTAQ